MAFWMKVLFLFLAGFVGQERCDAERSQD